MLFIICCANRGDWLVQVVFKSHARTLTIFKYHKYDIILYTERVKVLRVYYLKKNVLNT